MADRPSIDLSGSPLAIHIVGIGGAGMSAIATVLASMGHRVSGSDLKGSAFLDRLRALGVDVRVGHDAANVGDVDVVAASTAIPATQPRDRRGPRAHHPRAAACGDPLRGRRDQARSRRGRHPREDDDIVDARPRAGRGRSCTRRSSSAASSTRSAPVRCGTAVATFSSSRPTRATARSSSCPRKPCWSRTSSRTTSSTTAPSTPCGPRSTASSTKPPGHTSSASTTRSRPGSERHVGAVGYGTNEAADYRMVDVDDRTRGSAVHARAARRWGVGGVASHPRPAQRPQRRRSDGDGDRARRRTRGGRAGARAVCRGRPQIRAPRRVSAA